MVTDDYRYVEIQGLPLVDGKPGIRKEFSAWATRNYSSNIQVSLFIRALNRLYARDLYKDRLSFYQIAGIHGYPGNLAWDNSAPPPYRYNGKENNRLIYCSHNQLTFPTWHRPYMLLFEQAVAGAMDEVIEEELEFISEYEKKHWTSEKQKWRLPYWDWALPSYKGDVPDLFKPQRVKIRAPRTSTDGSGSEPDEVGNPLFRYQVRVDGKVTKFGNLEGDFKMPDVIEGDLTLPWSKCSGTSRWGITSSDPPSDQAEGLNVHDHIRNAIDTHQYWEGKDEEARKEISQKTVSDLVNRLLCNVHDWDFFASTNKGDPDGGNPVYNEWISLEYIHNNLHGFIGGSDGFTQGLGHMMNVPVAAFDPIFFMHHCNIDHYFAIWQVLNKDVWFRDDPTSEIGTATTELHPFHHRFEDGKVRVLNSNDVKHWQEFGYEYDCLKRFPAESDDDYRDRVSLHVNQTYTNTAKLLLEDEYGLFSDLKGGDSSSIENPEHLERELADYVINVAYDRYGYAGGAPYTIHFFLGAPPQQVDINALSSVAIKDNKGAAPSRIAELPRHVGSIYTFSSSWGSSHDDGASTPEPACGNCAQQIDNSVLSRASIPITIPLYHDAANDNIPEFCNPEDGEAVKRYLKDQLSWVAVDLQGMIIPWKKLGKTKVWVIKGKGTHAYKRFPSVTDGSKSKGDWVNSDGEEAEGEADEVDDAEREGDDKTYFSKYTDYEPLAEVTAHKPVGAGLEDW